NRAGLGCNELRWQTGISRPKRGLLQPRLIDFYRLIKSADSAQAKRLIRPTSCQYRPWKLRRAPECRPSADVLDYGGNDGYGADSLIAGARFLLGNAGFQSVSHQY